MMGEEDKPRIRRSGLAILMPTDFPIGVISEWTPPEREVVPITPLGMKVVREVVPVDDAIEYGECPVCGAEPGQQCSVTDVSGWQPEGPAYVSTTELAGWVHPERGG